MYRNNKKELKNFFQRSYDDNAELFSKNTVDGLLRSLLEPVASNNAVSLILTRFKHTDNIAGIIKRLEYCSNVEMYSFLDFDIISRDDFIETEFVVITSQRYNAALIWDYSDSKNKDETYLYIRLNSKDVNEVFETVKTRLKINLDNKFYSFRPERRENSLLNNAVCNVLKMLNENIRENEFNLKEQERSSNKAESTALNNKLEANIKHCCHEIKNQLSVIDIYTKILQKQFGDEQNISLIKKSLSLIASQLDDLRLSGDLSFREMNLKDVIASSIVIFEKVLSQNNNKISFVDNTNAKASAFIDEERFFAAISNIVKNANESTMNDTIEIRLENDANFAEIYITNHGEKIPQDVQQKLFEDGFTTKKDGWGVGLNICKKYIAAHQGTISLVKSDDSRTVFLVKIPLSYK